MSDPLNGLKPTTGYAELGNENDAGGEVEVGGICISMDRRAHFADFAGEYAISRDEMNADLFLIADAFNTYTATGLAPSQLAQALADEKALTAELTQFVEFVAREIETGDARLNFSRGSSLAHALSNALACAKGGTR